MQELIEWLPHITIIYIEAFCVILKNKIKISMYFETKSNLKWAFLLSLINIILQMSEFSLGMHIRAWQLKKEEEKMRVHQGWENRYNLHINEQQYTQKTPQRSSSAKKGVTKKVKKKYTHTECKNQKKREWKNSQTEQNTHSQIIAPWPLIKKEKDNIRKQNKIHTLSNLDPL